MATIENSSVERPTIREKILRFTESDGESQLVVEGPQYLELSQQEDIQRLWKDYLNKWAIWAEDDKRAQAVQKVYTDLFSMYQKQQRLGEAYEVVVGVGCLTWRTKSGQVVKRHLITAQTSIEFDLERGIISVQAAGEGAKPILEQDMLDPTERPEVEQQNAIEQQIAETGDDLWEGVYIQSALKSWANAVSSRSTYEENLEPCATAGEDPIVHFAPALILRKRTDRSLLRILKEIIDQLKAGAPIPPGVARLVDIIDDLESPNGDSDLGPNGGEGTDPQSSEIFFPLAANDEQRKIASYLMTRQGVLVQGPPGTGKSHTIANLICHLLASGKRILITSHTARALKVLRDKIPQEVANLCVLLLGDDLKAMQTMEESVQGISDKYNSWSESKYSREIEDLRVKLNDARKNEAETRNKLLSIREAETYSHPLRFGSYQGTAQSIAKALASERGLYSWIKVSPDENTDPPLSDADVLELLALLRKENEAEEKELSRSIVYSTAILAPPDFSNLLKIEAVRTKSLNDFSPAKKHPRYTPLIKTSKELRDKIKREILVLISSLESLGTHIQPWAKTAAQHVLLDKDRTWRSLLEVTTGILGEVESRGRWASEVRIIGLENRDLDVVRGHAKALKEHIEKGGKFGFGVFRPAPVKHALYLIESVRVSGELCSKVAILQQLIDWIETNDRLRALSQYWKDLIQAPTGSPASQIEEYKDLCEPLAQALELHPLMLQIKGDIASIPGLAEPTWSNFSDLKEMAFILQAIEFEAETEEVLSALSRTTEKLNQARLAPNCHPIVHNLYENLTRRDEDSYTNAYHKLREIEAAREVLKKRAALYLLLYVPCPGLAEELKASRQASEWDARLASFNRAWNWARADRWLSELHDGQAESRCLHKLKQHRLLLSEIMKHLSAALAWYNCFIGMTEEQRQHLIAWTKAMRRVGKGTGKYAGMHRKAAREHMDKCRAAIPAWVMPIYRVAESITPGQDKFDVVIIDEASQSGPEALFLLYLADKVVVVGDDKQIKPENVGLERQDVELLRQKFIDKIPHSDAYGLDNSFFDQAEIRYGGRIRLREHFRCMPEIIQFSNNLCYKAEPLIPLKQYGQSRLSPTVVPRYVHNGYQTGQSSKTVNEPEADAIVEMIAQCCSDEHYNGKTMGVISLLGESQAKHIERKLLEKIGPEVIEERQIVCGDAYAFQGDERNIMFLSMVSAPSEGSRIGTLASQRDERRFNVAASRAMDQMFLFHSATLSDLSPSCLRYRLLEYFLNPKLETDAAEKMDFEDLKRSSRRFDREKIAPPTPFDSWFEVDVFLKVIDKGYRVLPQHEVAGYHIDLVVEGRRGRLAIECDGDEWHGVEQYQHDTARQRMLERCGWIFWRVRGSAFYRNQDEALEDLWHTLSKHGIKPGGTGTEEDDEDHEKAADDESAESPGFDSDEHSSEKESSRRNGDERYEKTSAPNNGHVRSGASNGVQAYKYWTPKGLPDPRFAQIDDVVSGLVDIISVEGPIVCKRVYKIYAAAANIRKVGRQIRSVFNKAIQRAIRKGMIEQRNEFGTIDQINKIVRKVGTSDVSLRSRGNRDFEEIPPSEMGAMMDYLHSKNSSLEGEKLIRAILEEYKINRLGPDIKSSLLKVGSKFRGLV